MMDYARLTEMDDTALMLRVRGSDDRDAFAALVARRQSAKNAESIIWRRLRRRGFATRRVESTLMVSARLRAVRLAPSFSFSK